MAGADIVYVGKSLDPQHGGHNIIEPAILGKPIICGPNMENFRLVTEIFKRGRALAQVATVDGLVETLDRLLGDSAERERLSTASRQTVEQQRGASNRTIALLEVLPGFKS